LAILLLLSQSLISFFFTQLRLLEIENIYERIWFSIMDTCLALTIFRDDFDFWFVINLALLFFFKIFHWITKERIGSMVPFLLIDF
jgi:E3 ubiquitin-protein ligase synoviolin